MNRFRKHRNAQECAFLRAFNEPEDNGEIHEASPLRLTELLPVKGDRFVIRHFTTSDTQALADIEFNPDVKRFLALPDKPKAAWIMAFDPTDSWASAIEVDGVLAGRASLSERRGARKGYVEISIIIARGFWGLQLGRRVAAMLIQLAFQQLSAKGVVACVHPENRASIALLRSFGFRRRGLVCVSAESWQYGHLIYRLSSNGYRGQFPSLP